jgi:hypothetical protein
MKMPSSFSSSITALLLAAGLTLPAFAQSEPTKPEPAAEAPPQPQPVQSEQPAPAPTPPKDEAVPATEVTDPATPRASQPVDEFARIDTDRDGRISAKEYAASDRAALDMTAAGKRSGSEAPRGGFDLRNNEGNPQRSGFFRRLDADDDGYISREELAAGGNLKPET